MLRKSHTRVTLALDIIRKIESGEFRGYHELGIIKHQIDLHDVITIRTAPKMRIECDNDSVPCDNNNICWKAVELIQKEYKIDQAVEIQIQKNIPVMGGLAGGSTNAATVLMILNEIWDLKLCNDKLMHYGRMLGMDVPFYFLGGTAFDTEATGILQPIHTALKFTFVLAIPEFGVSTKAAYEQLDYNLIRKNVHKTESMRMNLNSNNYVSVLPDVHNDFEISVFKVYPRLAEIKQKLLDAGCLQSAMTGSGSTVLGIANDLEHARKIQRNIDCKTIVASSVMIDQ